MSPTRTRPGAWWRPAASNLPAALALLCLQACTQAPQRNTALDALPGWHADAVHEALPALRRSCARWSTMAPDATLGGPPGPGRLVADWAPACRAIAALPDAVEPRALRQTLATHFEAIDQGTGILTGYFEPVLRGSTERSPRHATPLHALPPGPGPHPSRAAIEAGALRNRGLELVWVDDAVDAFFLHIQGSGRVVLADGTVLRLGYAGQNGQPYFAIGRLLIQRGEIDRAAMSMQAIQAWLRQASPAAAAEVMHANPSYIFFRPLEGLAPDEGPLGSFGVPLTPQRSVAVDLEHVPQGAPVFLAAQGNIPPRLVVAQDTGGAIRGPARADLFWGWGDEAGARAGGLNQPTRIFLLVPRRR